MTGSDLKSQDQSGRLRDLSPEEYDEISITDLILRLWRGRATILLLSLISAFIIMGAAAWFYLSQQEVKTARVDFRLEFPGAKDGKYPNGIVFSTSDILTTPVLDRVYKANRLESFMKFPEFVSRLAVYQSNDQLRMLELEYAEKLSVKGLSTADRARLEAEFKERKQNLMIPDYSLLFVQDGGADSLTKDLASKVLQDVLKEWAEYAAKVKGVTLYPIEIVSPSILTGKTIEDVDFLVAADILANLVQKVNLNIADLKGLPGAMIPKVGEQNVSLIDLQERMNTLKEFRLAELIGLIQEYGISKNPTLTLSYLRNKLFDLRLKSQEASRAVKVYENSLSQYSSNSTGIDVAAGNPGEGAKASPQFDASFFDRLVGMIGRNSDADYRQKITSQIIRKGLEETQLEYQIAYYQNLLERISNAAQQAGKGHAAAEEGIDANIADHIQQMQMQIFASLQNTIDELNAIYKIVSENSLNPQSTLYRVTSPVSVDIQKPLRAKKLMIYAMMAFIAVEFIILIGTLLFQSFADRSRRPSR